MSETTEVAGLKPFLRDQVAAARVLRGESLVEEAKERSSLRVDACHLAMRFLDDLNGGAQGSHTVQAVIKIARAFEQYLGEP